MPYIGDVGTIIRVQVTNKGRPLSIPSNAVVTFYFKKPNKQTISRTGNFTNTGTDGKVHYVIAAGDLDVAGKWSVQVKVYFNSTNLWKTVSSSFVVKDVFN